MTVELPAPLVPADVDLRDFAFMPLDVARLRDSDLASDETPEACWAAVLLWCASWHQVPAASIPDSDQWQAKQCGYVSQGKVAPAWKRVKQGALRGWVRCDDGRLYHPVVSEKAADAWRSKMAQRWRTEAARVKKHNQRHELTGSEAVRMPEFDEWMSLGCPQGQALRVPGDTPPPSPGSPEENHSKGQGQGQGQGQGLLKPIPSLLSQAPALRPEDRPPATPQLSLVDPPPAKPKDPPDCPHQAVLALWEEVLPSLPQHLPSQWRGARADHLRARWRETAVAKGWAEEAQGLAYLRRLFAHIGRSPFLTGKAPTREPGKRPFVIELEWLVNPTNWAKVHEGKYHEEATA